MSTMIEVKDLRTYFFLDEGVLKAVDGVNLKIETNRTLGIIGESGCGKSVTAQSILNIMPEPGRIVSGEILFRVGGDAKPVPERYNGPAAGGLVDLAKLEPHGRAIRSIRGSSISMIFQEPMTSLSPVHTVGNQIEEAILLHRTPHKQQARRIAMDMLDRVGISNPAQRLREYPHQLSGGMRQRVMIAMALSCNPSLLIADEPTTALDVTVQAQILDLMAKLQRQFGMAIMYITHDLGVIAEVANEVAVMYLGRIIEQGTAHQIFKSPKHPYTVRLLRSKPQVGQKVRQKLDAIKGTVPIPLDLPQRCGFFSRCPERMLGLCDREQPAMVAFQEGHRVRCFLHSPEVEPPHEMSARAARKAARR
jgi:peptide/nickel transport system ATP-binding protein